MTGQLFKTSEASALVSKIVPGDETEVEPIRPAHRLVRINPDGITIGRTEEVVLQKTGASCDQADDDYAEARELSAKAEVPGMGSDASSSWTVVKRHSKMDRRFRQIIRPLKVLEERIPEGVHVILVGGKPGSGVRTCSIAIQERPALQRIVCERVEDCGLVALTGP